MSEACFLLRNLSGDKLTCMDEDVYVKRQMDLSNQILRVRDIEKTLPDGKKAIFHYFFFDKPAFVKDRYLSVSGQGDIISSIDYLDDSSEWIIIPLCTQGKQLNDLKNSWQSTTQDLDYSYHYCRYQKLLCAIKSRTKPDSFLGIKDGKVSLVDIKDDAKDCLWVIDCQRSGRSKTEKFLVGMQISGIVTVVVTLPIASFAALAPSVAAVGLGVGSAEANALAIMLARSTYLVAAATAMNTASGPVLITASVMAGIGSVDTISFKLIEESMPVPDGMKLTKEQIIQLYCLDRSQRLHSAIKAVGLRIEETT